MNRHLFPSLVVAAVAITLIGCDRKPDVIVVESTPAADPVAQTKTLETARLGGAVNAYERTPSAENLADVKEALADLDGEIAELEGHVANRTGSEREEASAKLKNLQAYRTAETTRFAAAQAKAGPGVPPSVPSVDARSAAEKVEDAAKRVGNTIENAAKETGDAIKDAVR